MGGAGSIAFLYPGQGAVPEQSPARLFANHPQVRACYEQLTTVNCPAFDDFHQQSPMNDLRAQLGVYGLSYALGKVISEAGIQPDCVAGYSSGLYAALAATGGIGAETGVAAVLRAYELMAACDLGADYAMVAVIGLDDDAVETILAPLEPGGWISLYNNRRQLIVSIPRSMVEQFAVQCETAGALRVVALPFERPCHIAGLRPAGEALTSFLAASSLRVTGIPFLAGGNPRFLKDPREVALAVGEQLWQPVNWHQAVEAMIGSGVTIMVSLDPTGVLGRIVRWISRDVRLFSIHSSAELDKVQAILGGVHAGNNRPVPNDQP